MALGVTYMPLFMPPPSAANGGLGFSWAPGSGSKTGQPAPAAAA